MKIPLKKITNSSVNKNDVIVEINTEDIKDEYYFIVVTNKVYILTHILLAKIHYVSADFLFNLKIKTKLWVKKEKIARPVAKKKMALKK